MFLSCMIIVEPLAFLLFTVRITSRFSVLPLPLNFYNRIVGISDIIKMEELVYKTYICICM